jgi:hypothetical protein
MKTRKRQNLTRIGKSSSNNAMEGGLGLEVSSKVWYHTPLRRHIERMGILISNDSSHRTRVISGCPSSTSHRK